VDLSIAARRPKAIFTIVVAVAFFQLFKQDEDIRGIVLSTGIDGGYLISLRMLIHFQLVFDSKVALEVFT
jgi:hypothetical protein